MRSFLLVIFFSVVPGSTISAQRKVLLEDFTGANCANCPLGAHYVDSMMAMYPNLIAVSLHSYSLADSMFFPTIDTVGQAYAAGAPLGAIDRIDHSGNVAVYLTQWDTYIQQRLAATPKLAVALTSTWDSVSRDIATNMQVNILSNIDSGDYRMSLYVVEDSVVGSGAGYDQENIYNTTVGSPFFGLGDPIIGFIHRRVVRALLPYAWGLPGVISSTPTTGQNYAHIFHYTLPANYDEHKISLVALVSAYSTDHLGDSVLNAAQEKLVIHPVTYVAMQAVQQFGIYPNPSGNSITFSAGNNEAYTLCLYNTMGQMVLMKEFSGRITVSKTDLGHSGMYYAKIAKDGKLLSARNIVFED